MSGLCTVIVCLFALILSSSCAETVVKLTDATFQTAIETNPKVLVKFFAPWCGHCKALAPEFEAAAKQLGTRVLLAEVDCTTEEQSCQQHEIESYPTLKWFQNGTSSDFEGARSQQGIVAFVLKHERPEIVEIRSTFDIDTFISASLPHSTVAVLVIGTDPDHSPIFRQVAQELRSDGFAFAQTVGELDKSTITAIANHLNISSSQPITEQPAVLLFKGFEDSDTRMEYHGPIASDSILEWIRQQSFPLFGEIGPDNYKRYSARQLPLLYFFLNPEDSETNFEIRAAVAQVAPDFRSRISFVHADGIQHAGHADSLGAKGTPSVVLHEFDRNHRYLHKGLISSKSLRSFLNSWGNKTLTRHLRSQAIPKKQSKAVQVLVGKNFNSVAMDDSKDVVVEFFAPWCGVCKKFGPIYEKWAQSVSNDTSLIVAAIDATQNDVDVPGIEFDSYPTVFFLPSKMKHSPSKFTGDRSPRGLNEWIKEIRVERDAPPPPPLNDGQKVHVLGDDTFDSFVANNSNVLVKFYVPWCGHCKALSKPFMEAAKRVNGRGRFAEVNCDVYPKICQRFDATSYPTLKHFSNSHPEDYHKGRTAEELTFFVVENGRSAVEKLQSAEQVHEFVSQTHATSLCVIAEFPAGSSSSAQVMRPFARAAENLRWDGISFAYFESTRVEKPSLKVYQLFDDKQTASFPDSDLEWQSYDLISFIKQHSFPLVGLIGPDTEQAYRERGLPLFHVWVDPNEEQTSAVLGFSREVARLNPDLSFVQADFNRFGSHAETMGVTSTPAFSIRDISSTGGRKYTLVPNRNQPLSVQMIHEFVSEWRSGSLKPFLRSSAIPEKREGKTVIELVGSTFESIVKDASKDVLVEFYAPWCGQCKKFAPVYELLAKKLSSDSDLIVSAIDSTANDADGIDITSYPTIIFFPKHDKSGQLIHQGARDVDSLTNWIQEHRMDKSEFKDEL